MTTKKFVLLLAVAFTIFYSCRKDDTKPDDEGDPEDLKGTYDFVGVTVASQSTVIVTEGAGSPVDIDEKTITTGYFISKSNSGTVTADTANFTIADLVYVVDTMVYRKFYSDGVLKSDGDARLRLVVSTSSAQKPYKLVGTDSIYFENGFVEYNDASGYGFPGTPAGFKYSWAGDTLILRTRLVIRDGRMTNTLFIDIETEGDQIIKLKKRK